MISAFVNGVRHWLETRATVRQLERLDDRALLDIGLTRQQILSAVSKRA